MSAAVALFAKAPVPGLVKTRLTPPLAPEEAAWIARVCLEETLRRFPPRIEAAWSLFLDGEPDERVRSLAARAGAAVRTQGRGGLGLRLARAFRVLRAAGAERVVAIGADSPTLDPAWIREGLEALREHDVVIGPTEDGGYYLIGSRIGPGPLFRDIPWGTSGVLAATMRRAREGSLVPRLLPPWYDLDDAADLRRAAGDLGSCPDLASALPELASALVVLKPRLNPATNPS